MEGRRWPSQSVVGEYPARRNPNQPTMPQQQDGPLVDLYPDGATISGEGWFSETAADNTVHAVTLWTYDVQEGMYVIGADLDFRINESAPAMANDCFYSLQLGGVMPTVSPLLTVPGKANLDQFYTALAGQPGMLRPKPWRLTPYGRRAIAGKQLVVQVVYQKNDVPAVAVVDLFYASVIVYVAKVEGLSELSPA